MPFDGHLLSSACPEREKDSEVAHSVCPSENLRSSGQQWSGQICLGLRGNFAFEEMVSLCQKIAFCYFKNQSDKPFINS